MSQPLIIGVNLVALTVLVFGLYFPRYHRKDMVVAIIGLNMGVMAVATALASAEVTAGLGLGLFGVLSIIRLRSSELAQEEVQVNAVCPGWVDTDMASEGLEGMAQAMGISQQEAHTIAMADVPLGRMSQPEEVAGLVAWLISEDARGVTGQTLDMNGGAFMA